MNNILAITYAFLLAYCPYDQVGIGDIKELGKNDTHTQIELGVDLFNTVNIYVGEETLQFCERSVFSWKPYTQSYSVGIEYHKEFNKKLKVNAGVMHRCQHPVDCWSEQSSNFNSARTELYVKLSGKINVF